ncbi:MAG: hypothetical protein LQ349_001121 [Xanthoria aureola]|nr:MAG: hypothetical protein LQ349_001121 [Xanthoria aureola]
MAQKTQADDILLTRFSEVIRRPRCHDWSAKVQDVCETIWAILDQWDQATAQYVMPMIKLLQDYDTFAITSLVIPELRDAAVGPRENPHKQRILESIMYLRRHFAEIRAKDQAYYDREEPLYVREKEIYAEAEMKRAHALLCLGLGQEQQEAVDEWLSNPPKCLSSHSAKESNEIEGCKGSKGDESEGGTKLEEDALYRAAVLFRYNGVLNPAHKAAILEWIRAKPGDPNAVAEDEIEMDIAGTD